MKSEPEIRKEVSDETSELEREIRALAEAEEQRDALRMVLHGLTEHIVDLRLLEEEAQTTSANPDKVEDLQGRLYGVLSRLNTSIGKFQYAVTGLSSPALRILTRVWNWFASKMLGILLRMKSPLKIQSWSIGATGGFPMGITTTITVTFAP